MDGTKLDWSPFWEGRRDFWIYELLPGLPFRVYSKGSLPAVRCGGLRMWVLERTALQKAAGGLVGEF